MTTEFIRLPSCRFANGLHLGLEPKVARDRNVQLTISKCARQPLSNKRRSLDLRASTCSF